MSRRRALQPDPFPDGDVMDYREKLEAVLDRRLPGLKMVWSASGEDLCLVVSPECLREVAFILRDDPVTKFSQLACITGVDRLPAEPRFELVYHLRSLEHRSRLVIRTRVPGDNPMVPTLVGIWASADWFEREIYDLLGISFAGHPDLRRILLPEDWGGHPLRKDYPLEGEEEDLP